MLQFRYAEVVDQRRRLDVHHRRGARDCDRLFHGSHLEYRVNPDRPVPFHDDAPANDRPESRRLEREVVESPPEGAETVRSVSYSRRDEGNNERFPSNRDRRSGYGQSLAVVDDALDRA